MNITEKYLIEKNKFNIDRKIIFESNDNFEKIKNNNEMLFLYNYIIKIIKKIDENENKYKINYAYFNNKLFDYKIKKNKLTINSEIFINRKINMLLLNIKKETLKDITKFYNLFMK